MKLLGLSVTVFPEAGVYSAVCPELDVASQGDTENEALANLKDALTLYLDDLDADELKAVVAKHAAQKVRRLELPLPALALG